MNLQATLTQNPLVVSDGLVGYWSFNEGTGTVVSDFSGNRNDGTLSGSTLPTWTIGGGRLGNALSFSGPLSINNGPSCFVDTKTPVTTARFSVSLCAWFKTASSTQDGQGIVFNGSDKSGNGYGFFVNQEGMTTGQMMMLYGGGVWFSTGTFVTSNVWHHGVMTIDATGVPRYYHDGTLAYTGASASPVAPTLYTDIGRNDYTVGNPTHRYFNGVIDEVRIYNKILNQGEVTALYNARAI